MICKTEDSKEIYYEVQGNLSAPHTLVFLNGLTQSTLSWGLMWPVFKEQYRIVLLDFVFQGRSSKEGDWRDFDQHARDLRSLLELLGLYRVHLVGLSYGSFVAQNFAVNFPDHVDKLILLSTAAHKNPYFEAIETSWEQALKIGGYSLLLDIMLPSVLSEEYFLNPLIPIENMKESRKELNQNTGAILKLMRATKERKDYRAKLREIHCPCLIIQGERDMLLPVHMASEVHQNIRGSKFIVIPNAGHTLNLEHVQDVCHYIKDFLST
ncbi:MAG TPA: alpha/beta hydrolase [Bacteroidia bacterium]|nr:alpha/beta hydrolase [Bacteroidia bacterium]